MFNKYAMAVHHYMPEFLKDRYERNKPAIDRIGAVLLTDRDYTEFMAMVVDVYEVAYMKAVEDIKHQMTAGPLTASK